MLLIEMDSMQEDVGLSGHIRSLVFTMLNF